MNQKEKAELDQGVALIAETMPPMWNRMYENLKGEGFNGVEAMKLLQTYILAQCPYGVRGDDG